MFKFLMYFAGLYALMSGFVLVWYGGGMFGGFVMVVCSLVVSVLILSLFPYADK